MAVDPRQVVAGFLTLSMFVMLGNMIKHDHFSSPGTEVCYSALPPRISPVPLSVPSPGVRPVVACFFLDLVVRGRLAATVNQSLAVSSTNLCCLCVEGP